MTNKAQRVRTRLVQLGCLLAWLFLALQLVPRAPAQRSGANENTLARERQISAVSSYGNTAGAILPTEGCFGSVVWDQYDSPATQPPIDIGSQQFEPGMTTFDNQAADDFVVSAALYITGVRVMGEYSAGGGPAESFNLYFYQNGAGNLPGTLIATFMNLSYVETPPDFLICLPYPFGVFPGTYWVSVQARQDSDPNGQWFWNNRTVRSNAGATWQNPGDGYGTGCLTWNRKSSCMADQVWPDQVFQILGFHEGPLPTPRSRPTPRYRPIPVPRP